MIFSAPVVLLSANPQLLSSIFTPFLSLPASCKNPTLLSKHSLIGLNRWFGPCALTLPQNVPALCRSKDWEDAGHKDAGWGWSNKENKTDLSKYTKTTWTGFDINLVWLSSLNKAWRIHNPNLIVTSPLLAKFVQNYQNLNARFPLIYLNFSLML